MCTAQTTVRGDPGAGAAGNGPWRLYHSGPGGRPGDAPARGRGKCAGRYGHRRHGRPGKCLPRRAFDGAGAARAGCQFRPCPQCGRQFQPGKSGHRCAKLRRHAAGGLPLRQPDDTRPVGRRRAVLGQAFSRPRRYGHGFPSGAALRGQKHGGAGTDGAAALPGGSACGRARGDDDTYPVPAARTGASSGNDVPAHHDGAPAGADGL